VQNSDPAFFNRLTGRALPLVVLAGVCGLAVLALLTAGRTKGIRAIAALGVAAVIWGWGVAQYPVLLPRTAVTLTNAGATQATFVALVVVTIAAVILVVPSFALLYTLQGDRMLGGGDQGTPPAADSRRHTGLPSAAHSGPPSPNHRPGSATRGAALGLVAIAAIAHRRRPR
jgi:cytochrome bd ubiquinol oxidase subunit II